MTRYQDRIDAGRCGRCGSISPNKRCNKCRDKVAISDRLQRTNLRKAFFDEYGHVCVCCGEDEKIFLTVDHINNDGNISRTKHIYRQIRDEGYPSSKYQTLCFNCNTGRSINGGICPHEQKE